MSNNNIKALCVSICVHVEGKGNIKAEISYHWRKPLPVCRQSKIAKNSQRLREQDYSHLYTRQSRVHKKYFGLNEKEPTVGLPGALGCLNVVLCMRTILPVLTGIEVIYKPWWAPSLCLDVSSWWEHIEIPGEFFLIQNSHSLKAEKVGKFLNKTTTV